MTAAALGIRGSVDLRRGDRPVTLTENSSRVWRFKTETATSGNRIAEALHGNHSLIEADQVTQRFGQSELTFEHEKAAATQAEPPNDVTDDLPQAVLMYARESLERGNDLITTRRLAEAVSVPGPATHSLIEHLTTVPVLPAVPVDLHALARAKT